MIVNKEKSYMYTIDGKKYRHRAFRHTDEIWSIVPNQAVKAEVVEEMGKISYVKMGDVILSVGAHFCDRKIKAIKQHREKLLMKLVK